MMEVIRNFATQPAKNKLLVSRTEDWFFLVTINSGMLQGRRQKNFQESQQKKTTNSKKKKNSTIKSLPGEGGRQQK